MWVGGQRHDPAALSPGKKPGIQCTGGWVGSRAEWTGAENPAPPPPPGFDRRTVQPVSSSYTDDDTPAHKLLCVRK
jgi:hypothetical protein